MFSKACEYAIRAMICLAACSKKGERLTLTKIAGKTDSPQAFTAKVLQQLSKAGLIDSMKGPNGGFSLPAAKARKVKLSHVVKAIDGDAIYTGCGLGLKECSDKRPCPLHDHFRQVRKDLRRMLEGTSIEELSRGLKEGSTFMHH